VPAPSGAGTGREAVVSEAAEGRARHEALHP